jgi:hypothetical protein
MPTKAKLGEHRHRMKISPFRLAGREPSKAASAPREFRPETLERLRVSGIQLPQSVFEEAVEVNL